MILFAQNRGPKAELQSTIWDKKEKNKQTKTKNKKQKKTAWSETKLKVQQ